jgi:hypothetical protein
MARIEVRMPLLDYAGFWEFALQAVGRCPDNPPQDVGLRTDLGLDDLEFHRLVIVLADLGVCLPDALYRELLTTGDVFYYYSMIKSAQQP